MIGASDLDRLCGYAVTVICRADRKGLGPLLDVLGLLDADRLCAIYFALPPERQRVVRHDPVWAYQVQQVERAMPEAELRLSDLIDETPASEVAYELARTTWP
jgi:hypothetical protein